MAVVPNQTNSGQHAKGGNMKQMTTQEIIQKSPETKNAGKSWKHVYAGLFTAIEQGRTRVVRDGDTLFSVDLKQPHEGVAFMFNADQPKNLVKNVKQFLLAMKVGGFISLTLHPNQSKFLQVLQQAGANVQQQANGFKVVL